MNDHSCPPIPAYQQCDRHAYVGQQLVAFTSHGRQYEIDRFGVIHQTDAKPYTYDANYVSTYDTEAYRRQSDLLQALRLGFTIAAHGRPIIRLLDFGYGNGAFMRFARQHMLEVWGVDITGVLVENCQTVEIHPDDMSIALRDFQTVNVITFWDALEHVPDLSFVASLKCETVVISLPNCLLRTRGLDWFNNQYKHRKPDEHLHHFDAVSLENFMGAMGWHKVALSHHEDIVRTSPGQWDNILTMAFKR